MSKRLGAFGQLSARQQLLDQQRRQHVVEPRIIRDHDELANRAGALRKCRMTRFMVLAWPLNPALGSLLGRLNEQFTRGWLKGPL